MSSSSNPRQGSAEPATVHLKGLPYLDALRALHAALTPATYLEIGTSRGDSLAVASCVSIAVDPAFRLDRDVAGTKPGLHLVRETSAAFFASGRLAALAPAGIDFAFIDGLHLIEAVLDDFIGAERHAAPGGLIALHDVLPINLQMAARDGAPGRRDRDTADWWTGDVWKIIPILARHRPDLKLANLDCPPTGLTLVHGLDPANDTLALARDAILDEWCEVTLDAYTISRLYEEARVIRVKSAGDVAKAIGRG